MKQATLLGKSLLQTLLFGIKSAKWIKVKVAFLCFMLFDFLFYDASSKILGTGLNLFLFSIILVISSYFIHKKSISDKVYMWSGFALIISAFNIFYLGNEWAYTIYFLSLMSLIGSLYNNSIKNVITSWMQGFISQILHPFNTLYKGLTLDISLINKSKVKKIGPYILLPLGIVSIFSLLYSASNQLLKTYITEYSSIFLNDMNSIVAPERFFLWILFFIFFGVFFVTPNTLGLIKFRFFPKKIIREERKSPYKSFPILGLTQELRIGHITFAALNIVLGCVLLFDAFIFFSSSVEYSAYDLSNMVHSGTYIASFTIALSCIVVLIFFRDNLNFHPKNNLLKKMATIWLGLNSIYVVLVGAKNMLYIMDYGLTMKRMSLLIFLTSCLAILYITHLKIKEKWTFHHVINQFLATLAIIVLLYSIIDHKAVIVYFSSTIQTENIDTNYLSTLCSDRQYLLYRHMHKIETKSGKQLDFYFKNNHINRHSNWKSFSIIRTKENEFYRTEVFNNLNITSETWFGR